MSARMRLAQLRRCAVEMDGAEHVEDLDQHVVVAACLRERDGAVGLGRDAVVIGAREQDRDANAQRECRVRESPRSSRSGSTRAIVAFASE